VPVLARAWDAADLGSGIQFIEAGGWYTMVALHDGRVYYIGWAGWIASISQTTPTLINNVLA